MMLKTALQTSCLIPKDWPVVSGNPKGSSRHRTEVSTTDRSFSKNHTYKKNGRSTAAPFFRFSRQETLFAVGDPDILDRGPRLAGTRLPSPSAPSQFAPPCRCSPMGVSGSARWPVHVRFALCRPSSRPHLHPYWPAHVSAACPSAARSRYSHARRQIRGF